MHFNQIIWISEYWFEKNLWFLGLIFGSKVADNGRYYRPIISVSLADYRYRPISIVVLSVVHYNILFFFFLSSSYSILFSGCILILNVVSISLLITCFQSFGTREASWLVDLLHPTRNKTLRMRNFLTKLQSLPHQVNGNPNKCYENATNSNHGKHPGIQMFIFWWKKSKINCKHY